MGLMKAVAASVALTMTMGVVGAPAFAGGAVVVVPVFCPIDHDHRSHDPNYYDYYPGDRYSRAGPYIPGGGDGRYGDGRYGDGRYGDGRYGDGRYGDGRYGDGRYGGGYGRGDRVVQRREFPTQYRARIVLLEQVQWTRRGEYLTCNVSARGPEAEYVRRRELRYVARNYCSPRSEIVIDERGYGYGDGWR